MKISDFIEKLDFPEKARVDKKVFKNAFFKNTSLTKSQRDVITDDIESINWVFALKEENTNIPALVTNEFDYSEVQIMGVELRSGKNKDRISDIIHKSIPSPVIIVFEYEDEVSLSTGMKRESKADKLKTVVEDIYTTEWISGKGKKEKDFIDSLSVKSLSHKNFYEFYADFADRVKLFIACEYIDRYFYENFEKTDKVHDKFLKISELEEEENRLKGLIKSAGSISEKVRLNIEIKDIEKSKKLYLQDMNN
jgi:hypothetical protein